MRRIERIITTLLAVALCALSLAPAALAAPSDVAGHWAAEQITALIEAEIVTGDPDGSFRPEDSITRAEFLALINRAAELEPVEYTGTFTDVFVDDWYATLVATAVTAGFLEGNGDGTCAPNEPVTRAQAAVMLDRALDLPVSDPAALTFADVADLPDWAVASIAAAVNAGYFTGNPDGTFGGSDALTRAQAAVLTYRSQADLVAAFEPAPEQPEEPSPEEPSKPEEPSEPELPEEPQEPEEPGPILPEFSTYAMVFGDLGPIEEFQPQPLKFQLTTVEVAQHGYERVRLNVTATGSGTGQAFLFARQGDGTEVDVIERGHWGPEMGFTLPADYSIDTTFTAMFTSPGRYEITFTLYDLVNDQVLAEETLFVRCTLDMP